VQSLRQKSRLIKIVDFAKYFHADCWGEYNKKFFDKLAPKYDFLNQIISCGRHNQIKRKAIRNIPIKPHSKIIDICTGSGDIAIFIARANPTCRIIGVDVSQNMLQIAREKAWGLSNIEFRTADALDLPFKDREYDVAIMGFGLRNLSDIKGGVLEMKRVTKPGGYVSSLDLGKPRKGVLSLIYKIYFEIITPFLGKAIFHRQEFNSFKYLSESNKFFPPPKELVEIFASCGLKHVKNYNFMLGGISQQTGIV
jgi:demethylmenaquinone methyltransferase/2-methoxy-6-polyprenyl-1,4-benzoquinol methylase